VSELPDGVYRVEITLDDVEAAGQTNQFGSTGLWTIEVDDGTYVIDCSPRDLPGIDCGNGGRGIVEAGHVRGTGNTVWFVYDVEMISELQGCQLPASNEPGHCYSDVVDYHLDWTLDGDTLTFSNYGPRDWGSGFTIEPWTMIAGASEDEVVSTEVADTALPADSAPATSTATIPLSELEGRIVFERWGGSNQGFFIADADGSNEQPLVPGPREIGGLTVARDGSRASIPTALSDGRYSVEIVDLADLSTVVLDPPGDPLIGTIGGPFSPDGTQIAYFMDPLNPPGMTVYIGPADDPTAAVQIVPTEPLPPDVDYVFPLDFSLDGRQLLLYVQAPGDPTNSHGSLAIINVDGSGFRPLTPEGMDVPCCAHWSPDGSTIVFAARDGRLLTIKPDGTGLTEVYSEADRWAFQPNWSPDGSRIIFSLDTAADPNSPSPSGLYVINADGTALTRVIDTGDHIAGAWWVPDIREPGDAVDEEESADSDG
jgi:dipeptidyl aminopeptidase/acylaminoacyl peptidase